MMYWNCPFRVEIQICLLDNGEKQRMPYRLIAVVVLYRTEICRGQLDLKSSRYKSGGP